MVIRAALVVLFLLALVIQGAIVRAGDLKEDLAFVIKHRSLDREHGHESFSSFFADETREPRLALMAGMRLYQIFISSQDMSACIFSPSCSRFGMRAISRFGPIHGGLMTADRLLRCHGIGKRYYPLDLQSGLSLDYPIDYYYLKYKPVHGSDCFPGGCPPDHNHAEKGN